MIAGNDNGDGPDNKRPSSKQPPDMDEIVNKSLRTLKPLFSGGSPRSFILIALLALIAIGVWTAYYTVPSDSVAVVQRFGKYLKVVPAGLHFKFPLGIDSAIVVPVKRQLKQEFGFATPGARDPHQTPIIRDEKRETQMVTGDMNLSLIHI